MAPAERFIYPVPHHLWDLRDGKNDLFNEAPAAYIWGSLGQVENVYLPSLKRLVLFNKKEMFIHLFITGLYFFSDSRHTFSLFCLFHCMCDHTDVKPNKGENGNNHDNAVKHILTTPCLVLVNYNKWLMFSLRSGLESTVSQSKNSSGWRNKNTLILKKEQFIHIFECDTWMHHQRTSWKHGGQTEVGLSLDNGVVHSGTSVYQQK